MLEKKEENKLPEEEQVDWDAIFSKFPVGTKVCGKIIHKARYGMWIEIEYPESLVSPNALIEIIRISDSPSLGNDILKNLRLDDTVCAIVIWLDTQSGIKLSTRKTEFEKYGFSEGW